MKKINSSIILILLFGAFTILLLSFGSRAIAQSEDTWSTPTNLSQSGAAAAPLHVIDPTGLHHVFWQDTLSGFIYVNGDGTTWSEPRVLRLPFSEPAFSVPGSIDFKAFYNPLLLVDAGNAIHSFWINETGALLYSRAPVPELVQREVWTSPMQLASSAAALDVVIGVNGRLHLSYVRPASTGAPAGVYYRQSSDRGTSWSEPAPVYLSTYLRSATDDQAHVQVTATSSVSQDDPAAAENVYIVWDNRLLDIVLETHSPDGGITWSAPRTVDHRQPEDIAEAVGPSRILSTASGNEVHLTWWAGHGADAATCAVYHEWSENAGESWQPQQVVFEDSQECPADVQFVAGDNGLLFLLTRIRGQVYLQLWNGSVWSEPEIQDSLAGFVNPETFRNVQLSCLQSAVISRGNLFVVGCGITGNYQDVWALERPLADLESWYELSQTEQVWSEPAIISSSSDRMFPTQLVVGADGRIHAFWSQSGQPVNTNRVQSLASSVSRSIYYARLNAGEWSPPRPVLTSPDGIPQDLAIAAGKRDSLFVVWSSDEQGLIYFSRAVDDRASSITEWIDPITLPISSAPANWPDIIVDSTGTIYVAYAVPLNEDRGIYLVRSEDNGDTWSDPVRVFDGREAEWQVVGRPRLTMTDDNHLHLLWTRNIPSSDDSALSMVYARSQDSGWTWSEPETVVEENVIWSDVVGINDRVLHRVWLSINQDRTLLWQQHSLDSGFSWSAPVRISSPVARNGPTTLIVDANKEPHLLQLAESSDGQLVLQEWLWDGEQWQSSDGYELSRTAINADSIAAAVAPDGTLGVVYKSLLLDNTNGQMWDTLSYINRQIERAVVPPTPLPTLTPSPEPSATSTPVPEPTATPTVTFAAIEQGRSLPGPFDADNRLGGIIIGLIPSILIILIVFVVGLRIARAK